MFLFFDIKHSFDLCQRKQEKRELSYDIRLEKDYLNLSVFDHKLDLQDLVSDAIQKASVVTSIIHSHLENLLVLSRSTLQSMKKRYVFLSMRSQTHLATQYQVVFGEFGHGHERNEMES
jgi:hypothetical protein